MMMIVNENSQYCYQDGNSSCRKTSISTSIYIMLYTFLSLLSVVTVFLNLLVIITISNIKHLHTPSNLLILSLAVSDLLVGLIGIPAMTVAIMEPCWLSGKYFCALLIYTTFLCECSCLCNLVLMSIDRYVAVCDPLRYHLKVTTRRTMCCISISWCFSIMYDGVYLKVNVNVEVPSRCFQECYFFEGHFLANIFDLVLTMVIPCFVIIILYLKIFIVARSQARQVFSRNNARSSCVKMAQANKSERKAAKTLGIVVFNYLLFWNPIVFLFSLFNNYKMASFIISFLPLFNSFINPIIYAYFYPQIRKSAKHILTLK